MKERRVGIIMNGVTGRMGSNQHLMRSILEIISQGGVRGAGDEVIMPDPVLVGRDPQKLRKLAEVSGLKKWATDPGPFLSDPAYEIYFDAQTTARRAESVERAIGAGKHIYCEKPLATSTREALGLWNACNAAGVKHGVVQDKLWLPGLIKLERLLESGFFGKVHAVKGDFGYWVFEGHGPEPQRPSWNYRKEDGGGIIMDMLCHWRYVLDRMFGDVRGVFCMGASHIPRRLDETGIPYECTAEDAAYAIFELQGGIIAQFNSSWATRVRRDDLLTIQVDGSRGSAVAGLRECRVQAYEQTPRPVWNPDLPNPIDFFAAWPEVYGDEHFDNAFKAQWELFLRHVVWDEPFPWDMKEGAKGVQLAEKGMESWLSGSWKEIPAL